MDEFTRNAILSAIRIEKTSYDFYLLLAGRAEKPETYRLLMALAEDEFEHLAGFLRLYPGDGSEITAALHGIQGARSGCRPDLWAQIPVPVSREEALTVAIKEEQACIDLYSTFVESIRLPEVHIMFTRALDETRQHLETIEAEYACCMGMVNDADMDSYVRE